MKKIIFITNLKLYFLILIGLFLYIYSFGQVPEKMSYQAVIRDSGNKLVQNKTVGFRLSILQGSVSGNEVYSETQYPVTNTNGLISIEYGGEAGFNSIKWEDGPFFIKTETDPYGGSNYNITGTSQILSVPYSYYSLKSGSSTPGPKGDQGDQGDQGIQGVKGDKGDKGDQGIQGEKGDKGDQGEKGDQGDKGDQGNQGIQGPPGTSTLNSPIVQNISNISPNKMYWLDAAEYCKNLVEQGFDDWHLPSAEEFIYFFIKFNGISLRDENLWTSSFSFGREAPGPYIIKITTYGYIYFEDQYSNFECRCVR